VFFILPKAELSIVLKSERVDNSFDLDIDKNAAGVNIENNTIPGELIFVEKDGEKTAQATGIKDVGQKATGKITLTNKTGISRSFVAQTRFKTAGGLYFVSNSAFVVAAASLDSMGNPVYGAKTVDVSAQETGEAYNIAATSFSIIGLSADLNSKVIASSSAAMVGGLKKQIKVVSESDYNTAKDALKEELLKTAKQELKDKKKTDQSYSEDTLVVEETGVKSTPAVGSEAESFKVELTLKVSALAYKTADYQEVVKANFEKAVSDQDKVLVQNDTASLKQTVKKNDISKTGILSVEVAGQMWAAPKTDNQKILDSITGKGSSEVKDYFAKYKEIQTYTLNLSPFWVKTVPVIEKRVHINIEYTQTANSSTNSNTNAK
jgi:hypothetical protein